MQRISYLNDKKAEMHNIEIRHRAFTLAEVLITLGIIGIVAALTLPALIQNHQEKANIIKLKKFYSVMNQAVLKVVEQNGPLSDWDNTKLQNLWTIFSSELNVVKKCYEDNTCNVATVHSSNGSPIASGTTLYTPAIILGDGTIISSIVYNNCANGCALLRVDINGNKLPNTLGKDVFDFILQSENMVPQGRSDQESGYTFEAYCKNYKRPDPFNGSGCAAWVIYNDNMDYLHCSDLSWNGKTKCEE